jgi:MFS family permease
MTTPCYTNLMTEQGVIADRPVGYSWYALAVLTIVYVLNFLDRQVMYILFQPIKAEMGFSDLELALLGSTSFVIFYTLLGIPFGRLADRVSRKTMIAIGLATWSLFSGLTGFANGFWSIFLCRLMVGVGEATLGPAAFSLLGDYFPVRMRGTVNAIYASAIATGGGLAFFLGGWIGQNHGWRTAFWSLGFPGLALAVAVFFLREPPRGRTESAADASGNWRDLFRSKTLVLLFIGYALVGLASNNIAVWVTVFFVRVHHLTLIQIGTFAGIISLTVGVAGMVYAGVISDRLSRRLPGGRLAFTAIAALASVPLWIALLFVNNLTILVVVNTLLYVLAILWVGPATADVIEIAGPRLRGLAIGIFFSIIYVAAYFVGSPLIGKLSDTFGVATDPGQMRYSLLVCPTACLLGALFLWLASRARVKASAP